MERFEEMAMETMQAEIDAAESTDSPVRCASCMASDIHEDDVADATEPVRVREHYAGWASPLQGWRDLGDHDGWLVPMCAECAAMTRSAE